jgi:hypothetical protein
MELAITAFVMANLTWVLVAYAIGALLSTVGMRYLFGCLGEMETWDWLLAVGSGLLFPIVVPIFVAFSFFIAATHSVKLLLGKGETNE